MISVSLHEQIVSLCRSMDLTSQMINLTIGVLEHNNSTVTMLFRGCYLCYICSMEKTNELKPKNNSHLY